MQAGAVNIKLMADITDIQRKMAEAQRSVAGAMAGVERSVNLARDALATLGVGLSIGAIADYARAIIDGADSMNDMSQRTGIAIAELAKYQLATSQSGTSMEALSKGVKSLSVKLVENGPAFKAAGINARDANGALLQIADLFSSMPDGVEKTTLAVKMLEKGGMEMIPMLNMGSAGLKESAEKAARYAAAMQELAPKADLFNDQLAEVALYTKASGTNMMNDLMPGLLAITKAMADASREGGALSGVMAGIAATWTEGWGQKIQISAIKTRAWFNELEAKKRSLFGDSEGAKQYQNAANEDYLAIQKILNPAMSYGDSTRASDNAANKALDDWKQRYEAFMKSMKETGSGGKSPAEKAQEEAYKAALKIAQERQELRRKEAEGIRHFELQQELDRQATIKRLTDATPTGKLQAQQRDMLALAAEFEAGRISEELYLEAVTARLDLTEEKITESTQSAEQMNYVFTNAFKGMEDALVGFVQTGKLSFSGLIDSFIADLLRYQIQQSITLPLMGMLSNGGGGLMGLLGITRAGSNPAGYGGTLNNPSAFLASANGNAFDRLGLVPFATGGIFNQPTAFGFGGGRLGVLGEAGPEAVMPLARGADGKLGVRASGQAVNITINATVGNVASQGDVVAGMQIVRQQILGQLSRNNSYGGIPA